jgi:endoglucanase
MDLNSIENLRTEMYQTDGYVITQKETFEFCRTIAKHFKGNNTFVFCESFNEPTIYNRAASLLYLGTHLT